MGVLSRLGGSRLWHPGMDMDREPTMVCRVPVNAEGDLCLAPFYPGEERTWAEHMRTCAIEHRDAIHACSPRTRAPWTDPEFWDPELSAHNREVGRRMLREGRLLQHPNERAGS